MNFTKTRPVLDRIPGITGPQAASGTRRFGEGIDIFGHLQDAVLDDHGNGGVPCAGAPGGSLSGSSGRGLSGLQ